MRYTNRRILLHDHFAPVQNTVKKQPPILHLLAVVAVIVCITSRVTSAIEQ